MKQRTSQTLYAYWNNVRAGRLAPRRLEIEPARISPILAETFILERMDSRTYTFRLAGTRICDNLAAELRGRNLIELFREGDREDLEAAIARVSAQGAVLLAEIAVQPAGSTPGEPQRTAYFELLLLPLTHTRDEISRYLGALTPIKAPLWLGHEVLGQAMLLEHRLLWPDGRPHSVVERVNRQAPLMAELAEARVVRFNRRQFRILEGGRKGEPDGTGS